MHGASNILKLSWLTKMKNKIRGLLFYFAMMVVGVIVTYTITAKHAHTQDDKNGRVKFRAVLLPPDAINPQTLIDCQIKKQSVVLSVKKLDSQTKAAAQLIKSKLGSVDYFFEIARCEELATKHPRWMASIQGHDEWMRLFPDMGKPGKDEIVKVFPWVPVFYAEAQKAHLERVNAALNYLPKPKRVWLNDVQGAPSACGCGHPLCRWTSDYGKILTASKLGDEAPATFVEKVQAIDPDVEVIPIMTSECEEADKHETCAGVGCFEGACWKAFTKQLDLVAQKVEHVGVACFYKEYNRDLKRYGKEAGWVEYAINSFKKMPQMRGGKGVSKHRLVAVVQGWDVTKEELNQQIKIAESLRVAGVLICTVEVQQSWQPKIIKLSKQESDK